MKINNNSIEGWKISNILGTTITNQNSKYLGDNHNKSKFYSERN